MAAGYAVALCQGSDIRTTDAPYRVASCPSEFCLSDKAKLVRTCPSLSESGVVGVSC